MYGSRISEPRYGRKAYSGLYDNYAAIGSKYGLSESRAYLLHDRANNIVGNPAFSKKIQL